jgi:ribosomal protein S18 acetylase RimI-like enzyme
VTEFEIHHIEPFRARDVAGAIGRIYQDAHGCPEEDALAFVNGAFARHTTWPGFVLLVATFEGIPAGFVYGYDSRPGQWWHDTIRPAMVLGGKGDWQEGAFELAEIAVVPAVQGRGIGSALIRAFLVAASGKKVLLSADMEEGNRARALYRRLGFIDLVPDFRYPGFDDVAVIMGRPVGAEIKGS